MSEENIKLLKKAGLKITEPRLTILSLMQNNRENMQHFSAEDIYKMLLEQGEDIGLATVYRVLNQFDEANILIRHNIEGNKSVFELAPEKTTQNISVMRWVPSVTSLSPAAQSLWDTGQQKATTLKPLKAWLMILTLSVLLSMKIVNQSLPKSVLMLGLNRSLKRCRWLKSLANNDIDCQLKASTVRYDGSFVHHIKGLAFKLESK